MAFRLMGSSGIQVSPLCLGTMNFGNERWGCEEKESHEIMDRFFELGGNFIDTANAYAAGKSEEIIGRALKGRRDDWIVATKGFFPRGATVNDMGNTRRNLRRQLEDSLRRLDMDCVDLYQIHMWDALTPVEETLSVLSDLVHEGKTHYIGACNLTGWQLAMFMERAEAQGFERFVTIQPQYSLACRDIEQELLPAAYQYDLGVLAWSPLAFGLLSGKYGRDGAGPDGARLSAPTDDDIMLRWKERTFTARNLELAERLRSLAEANDTTPVALAIRWVLEQPQLTSAIIGPRTVEQLEGNFAALDFDLDEELFLELEEMSEPTENYLEYMQGGVNLRRTAELE
jgi:aryl-alcohol dehydrogenase-like predicted oxidoreductase